MSAVSQAVERAAGAPVAPAANFVMRREGDYWTFIFAGGVCRLHHSKGLEHLARLLIQPRIKIAAAELNAVGNPEAVDAERARQNVTRALRAAIERIAVHHPTAGEHLTATIRTGRYCCYTPDPRAPIVWEA